MRIPLALATLVLAAALAGCNSDGDDHDHVTHTCPDGAVLREEDFDNHDEEGFDLAAQCPGGVRPPPGTPPATPPVTTPNTPPVLRFVAYDAGGNATNTTTVGGSLTFSAEGSTDDGRIDGVAATINDGNRTNLVLQLHDGTRFLSQTVRFDRPGVVSVQVSAVDNRGEFTRLDTAVYVNQVAQFADTFELGVASGAPGFSPCRGPASALGGQLIDQQFYGSAGIVTRNTTSYVSAVLVAGAATITICDNENQPVSPSTSTRGNVIITNPDVVFPNYDPDNDFYVSVISNFPNNDVLVEYTVHFEPRPADAA